MRASGCHDAEAAQERNAAREPDRAAGERDDDGLGEKLPQDTGPARAEGETEGDFAPAVGGARGEEASEVGAGGEQNEPGEERQSAGEGGDGTLEEVAVQGWAAELVLERASVLRVVLFHPRSDGVQVGRRPVPW